MNRTLVIAVVVLILIAACLAIFAYAWRATREPAPSDTNNPFGFSGTTTPGGASTIQPGNDTRMITLSDGTAVAIPDITDQPQPEWANDEMGYRVAGDIQADFDILFYPGDSGFSIALLSEPLGESRRKAENSLRSLLKLSDAQLCKLNSTVGTTRDVSETYAGEELGLSFCPGSVKLP